MNGLLRRARRRLGRWLLSFDTMRSDGYVPGGSGWVIDGYGNAEFSAICSGEIADGAIGPGDIIGGSSG